MRDHAPIKPTALSDDIDWENLDWEEEDNLTGFTDNKGNRISS